MSEQQSEASTSRPGSPVAPLPDFSTARPYRFNWDAASRKQGPASVSGTSEGRGDYFAYKPALNLSFSSSSLALGAIPQGWSSAKHGFNAISTLVNSPHKKSAPPKAHSSVPLISTSQLPRIRRKDFDAYLKSVGSEWDKFTHSQKRNHEDESADAFAARLAELDVELPSTSSAPLIARSTSIPELDTVPSIFFEKNFDLSNVDIFAAVTQGNLNGPDNVSDDYTKSQFLLDRLSHYADTIELHLVREISLRSSSFFAALSNLNDLQTESTQCLERIRKLRGMLHNVGDDEAKKGLSIVRLERKLKNLSDVQIGVKSMQSVGDTLLLTRNLASGGEWDAALSLLEQTQKLCVEEGAAPPESWAMEKRMDADPRSERNSTLSSVKESISEEPSDFDSVPSPPLPYSLPLASLTAFFSLPDHLRALTLEIASSLSSEFVSTLRTDLLSQMERILDNKTGDAQEDRALLLKDRLRPLMHGLLRIGSLKGALTKWTSIAQIEIRASVKKRLPSSDELEDEESNSSTRNAPEKGAALRDQIQSMPHEEFMILLRNVYGALEAGIHETQVQNTVQQHLLDELCPQFQTNDSASLHNDLSDILSAVIELAHSRSSKILSIRAEQHAALDLPQFLDVFNETWEFVIRTETICRKMFVSLRGTVVAQAKAFLQSMHQSRVSKSSTLVEEEQWAATDVPASVQSVANVIVDSAVRDSPELLASSASPANGVTPVPLSKQLTVEDRTYFAVSATQKTLALVVDYLKVIVNLSLLTSDTVSKVIEFLKAFNSRTCQVVLGAGAMRSAGLKNITAKHLALASQSLSIVIALVPYIRECFRRHLNAKQAVMLVEFDKLKRDYQIHQDEIHSKLVAIMGDRLTAHCRSLQNVDWSAARDSPNEYIVMLVKETVTLHKVLSRYLQENVLEYIMTQVFAAINHRIAEEYGKIELQDQAAKDRLLRDATYLKQQFSGLKNVNASASMLETVVKEKPLAGASAQTPPGAETSTPADSPPPQTQSTHRSANERLRSMFRRSSAVPAPSESSVSPVTSPVAERPHNSIIPVTETSLQEPVNGFANLSPTPPPLPEKLSTGDNIVRSLSPASPGPSSPNLEGRPRSPRVLEKALPVPVPVLDEEGNIVDHPDSPRPSGEGRDLEGGEDD